MKICQIQPNSSLRDIKALTLVLETIEVNHVCFYHKKLTKSPCMSKVCKRTEIIKVEINERCDNKLRRIDKL
jgi:hypothetical protein